MTVLVLGLDGLDYYRVQELGLLPDIPVTHLEQDFEGENALYTYRVWPCIFAGETGGAVYGEQDGFQVYEPEGSFVWETYSSSVFIAPVSTPAYSQENGEFPELYAESFAPKGRIDDTLLRLERGVKRALESNEYQLVVACTRTPDIVGHYLPEQADRYHRVVSDLATELVGLVDEYLIVSDHGFREYGVKGLEAHTRDAVLASTFADYDTMTDFCEHWQADLAAVIQEQQLHDLGYL